MILKKFSLSLVACLVLLTSVFAQLDVDVDINESEWYESPIVWVGGAVFLIVLAFIARGGKKAA